MLFKKDDYGWIDTHNHVWVKERDAAKEKQWIDNTFAACDKFNIEKICVSCPNNSQFVKPDEFKDRNNRVLEAMKISDRFLGFCFVNPGWAKEACDEIRRCFDLGMVGIKLYHQYHMSDPAQTAVCKFAGELGMPIMIHAGKAMPGTDIYATQPRLSDATHMIEAAKRFPQTTFIQGHIGGGGDWEWNVRALEECPENLYVDISGSVHDAGIIRKLVNAAGAEHVLFATDMSYESSVGKLLDAKVSDAERRLIARDNFLNIMKGLKR